MILTATLEHLDALIEIENRCFNYDRLSRRSFRRLLTKGHAVTLIDIENGVARGYSLLFFNSGTSLARLYSFAVLPEFRGAGLAKALLRASEDCAREQECISLRLEVRRDNTPAITLFTGAGFEQFGIHEDYYEDHMQALRLEKSLVPALKPELLRVPYYRQTLYFTCGPAALMMAMKALDPALLLDRKLEMRIWREATTVFMTSGYGGCGPYGLALSAYHRGFDVELHVRHRRDFFIDTVRDPGKKEVIRLVEEDFLEEIHRLPIQMREGTLTVEEIKAKFLEGGIPIVLISSYRICREKSPHWVVVTGFDDHYIYVHDPFVDEELNKTVTDCVNMPILQKDFQRMARYGKAGQKAVLILSKN